DSNVRDESQLAGWRADLQRDRQCAPRIIFMSNPRSERAVEIAPFIADRAVDQEAFVASQDSLHPTHEIVQFLHRRFIDIVIDPFELDEQSNRRTQFCEELTLACPDPIVNCL